MEPKLRHVRWYIGLSLIVMVVGSVVRSILINSYFTAYASRLTEARMAARRLELIVSTGYRTVQMMLAQQGYLGTMVSQSHLQSDLVRYFLIVFFSCCVCV